jgi:hypothetical protein
MSAASARGHYANPPLEDEDDLIDPDDGKSTVRQVPENVLCKRGSATCSSKLTLVQLILTTLTIPLRPTTPANP